MMVTGVHRREYLSASRSTAPNGDDATTLDRESYLAVSGAAVTLEPCDGTRAASGPVWP